MKKGRLWIGGMFLSVLGYLYVFLVLLSIVPLAVGYKNYIVRSGSMEPTIPVGSCIYVKKTEFCEISEGDIITYCLSDTSTVITHRVTQHDLLKKLIRTKGDANTVEDTHMVKYEQILGKVRFYFPLLGYFLALHNIPGVKCFGIGLLLAVVFWQMYREDRKQSCVQVGETD